MYCGKRVGVAMATYNGEKYIAEQLLSILNQTVVPDEILVSDDGSADGTLDVVRSLSQQAQQVGTEIVIRTDNPRHGIGGNFEWAITHSTCDYIFICGQDDIWMPEKVAHTIQVFDKYPDVLMVCHDLEIINELGDNIQYDRYQCLFRTLCSSNEKVVKATRGKFLEAVISSPLMSGTSICLSSTLSKKCMPIPVNAAEDQWLQFCATAEDQLYFLNEHLVKYRIHDSASHSLGMGWISRIRKIFRRIRNANKNRDELVRFSSAAIKYLDGINADPTELERGYTTAKRVYDIGCKELDAARSGRILGAYKLTKLFFSDMRYRRIGTSAFLTHLANILLFSKSMRRQELEQNKLQ